MITFTFYDDFFFFFFGHLGDWFLKTSCIVLIGNGEILLQLNVMSNWTLVNVDANRTLTISPWTLRPMTINDSVITVDLVGDDAEQKVVYFGAPDYYLGKFEVPFKLVSLEGEFNEITMKYLLDHF